MDSGLTKLDSLPIEILRLIASVGTCESALALSAVNKILRSACHDPSIYKVIIDNRNGNVGPEWRHSLPLTMQSPVSAWARYALADFKAAQDHTLSLEPEKLGFWAPQLVAYHRKFLAEQKIHQNTHRLRSLSQSGQCLGLERSLQIDAIEGDRLHLCVSFLPRIATHVRRTR